jgi:hypothetical protein
MPTETATHIYAYAVTSPKVKNGTYLYRVLPPVCTVRTLPYVMTDIGPRKDKINKEGDGYFQFISPFGIFQ